MTRQRDIDRQERHDEAKGTGEMCAECGLERFHVAKKRIAHYCPRTGRCQFTGNERPCSEADEDHELIGFG